MKISIIITNLVGGGAERVNISLAKEFSALGFEVEFVLSELKGVLLDEIREFNIVELKNSSKLSLIRSMSNYFNDKKPDYVIVSMWGLTAYAALAKLFSSHDFKLLLVEHSSLINQFKNSPLKIRLWLRVSTYIAYRVSDYVAGVSTGVAQDMAKVSLLKKIPHVLYNPIPVKVREKLNYKELEYKIIVTAGRLIDAKEHATLIKAFSRLETKCVKLIILGEGPLLNELKETAKKYNVEDRVIFKGFVNNPCEYYSKANLFVLSSEREGFGNVIVEALGCGTPVVSTDCKHGPREILDNGKYGTLVPVGDAEALAKAMDNALKVEHNKEKLIERAKDFSPAISARRYLEVLGVYADERK